MTPNEEGNLPVTLAVSPNTPPPVPTLWTDGDISGPWPCTFPLNWSAAWGDFVYILRDAHHRVAYVGQTGNLVSRLKTHGRNKTFHEWLAIKSKRGEALRLEAEMINTLRPYLYNDGTVRSW